MLETADLPAGFRPYLPMTGPLNAQRGRQLGGVVGQVLALLHGWVRWWVSPQTGVQVIEEAYDTGTSESARAAEQGFDSRSSARGLTARPIDAHLQGFRFALLVNGIKRS
jgi:hypothetical protein